jgi:hypothetical protein
LVLRQPYIGLGGVGDVAGLEALLDVCDVAQRCEGVVVEDVLRYLLDAEAGVAAVVGATGGVRREQLCFFREAEEFFALFDGLTFKFSSLS